LFGDNDKIVAPPEFDTFWSAVTNKVSKLKALRAWNKLSTAQKLRAVETYPKHIELWRAEDRTLRCYPYPATWLNGWRFDDEIAMPAPRTPPEDDRWWRTDQGVEKMGAKMGLTARGGESYTEYAKRIAAKIRGESP
jgi:hypothetical protein